MGIRHMEQEDRGLAALDCSQEVKHELQQVCPSLQATGVSNTSKHIEHSREGEIESRNSELRGLPLINSNCWASTSRPVGISYVRTNLKLQ